MPKKQSEKQPKLSAKQQKFVGEYVVTGNGAEAARRAGYSPKTAKVIAYENLTKPYLSDAVQKRIELALANAKVTPEEVIGSAVRQMRSSINDMLDDEGYFDIEKARETGAIDLVKEMEIEEKYNLETKDRVVKHKIKMLTNQDGRKEVANYTNVEQLPNTPTRTEQFYLDLIYKLATDHKTAAEDIFRRAVETDRIPREFVAEIEVKLLGNGK